MPLLSIITGERAPFDRDRIFISLIDYWKEKKKNVIVMEISCILKLSINQEQTEHQRLT